MQTLDWRDERVPQIAADGLRRFVAVANAAAAYREAVEKNSEERPSLAALVATQLCRWQAHNAIEFRTASGRTLTDIEVCEALAHVPSDEPRDARLLAGVPIEPLVARVREVARMHLATRPLADALVEDVTGGWEAFRYAVAQQVMLAAKGGRHG